MGTTILTALGPTILSIVANIAAYFLQKRANDEVGKKEYIQFLEIMAKNGARSAAKRLEAQGQIDAVKELWKKEKEGR